ncbi:MAG: glycine dehydrogenase, partial [Chthoniobacteraceae bacterium]
MHEPLATLSPEPSAALLAPTDTFIRRHLGPSAEEVSAMLKTLGLDSVEALVDTAVPKAIRLEKPLALPPDRGEHETLAELRSIASRNKIFRSYLGQGYSDCITPPVIQRNILENPGWYTAYTPYQAEIAQGRLEALVNFQTLITDLTGLEISNSSLLDEATAAAEAMAMAKAMRKNSAADTILVSRGCHPQTINVVQTRAEPIGVKVIVADEEAFDFAEQKAFAVLLQYPDTTGAIRDYSALIEKAHAAGTAVIMAADLLALTVLRSPGELGADMAVGSSQRFGVPLGYGGPHAGYLATRDQFKRVMPGRLVGVSHDAQGNVAYRLALQTREQH